MSASFQVNHPTELTIKLTIQNNVVETITVQQQQPTPPLCYKPQLQHQPQPHPLRALPPTSTEKINDLLRDFNSLSMNNDPVEKAVTFPPVLNSVNNLEPPVHLDRTKRRERAHPSARPAAIPCVPDIDSFSKQPDYTVHQSTLTHKGPEGGRPLVPGSGTSKMQRGDPEIAKECDTEAAEEVLRELFAETDDDDNSKHKRQSSFTPDSPSMSSCHDSFSPGSYISAPTPPQPRSSIVGEPAPPLSLPVSQPLKRGRGRPPKPRPDGAPPPRTSATPRSTATGTQDKKLQPRPPIPVAPGISESSFFSISSFIPADQLAEANKVMKRYTDMELITLNDRGELLSYTFAKEGNWAKYVALIFRLLNNAPLGGIFAGINSASRLGHTPLIEAVEQQNVKAVSYCLLFTCSSDENLFRAAAESVLLPNEEIFSTILQKMCLEIDENGNPIHRTNRFIDKPISGWSFRNHRLNDYARLTLAQILTLSSPEFHPRLLKLIRMGADPRRAIVPDAPEHYRCYLDCVHLAAAFSMQPFECLQIFGMKPDEKIPFSWDPSGETLDWCVNAISKRTELDWNYRKSVCERLDRMFTLDVIEIEGIINMPH